MNVRTVFFCLVLATGFSLCGFFTRPFSVGANAQETVKVRENPEKERWEVVLKKATAQTVEDPNSIPGWMNKGIAHDRLGQYKESEAAYTKALGLQPSLLEAIDRRGSARFFQGDIAGSIRDFDAYLMAKPNEKPGHWRRGIALYYAGDFNEGARQFEGYQSVDNNDVENAVWHFLCLAAKEGIPNARKKILPIGKDRRVPLMEVYSLFKDEAKEADVLQAVESVQAGPQRELAAFYAHLYLALWREINRDKPGTLKHLKEATGPYRQYEYMGEVARVHREWIEANKWPKLPEVK
jgi:lipoprotein NlpI